MDGEYCDPKITFDRGAWFDGQDDYMTFENFRLTSSFSLRLWIREHGEGTLFSSSNKIDEKSAEKFFALYIDHSCLTFTDTDTGIYYEAAQRIKKYWWHYVVMDLDLQMSSGSTIRFNIDGNAESPSAPIARTLIDADDNKKAHRLGVLEFRERYENFYRGYIYTFEATYGVIESAAHFDLSEECDGSCTFCPNNTEGDNICLGICNWNRYYDIGSS